ncbi:MAG: thioredoxin [Bacteroidota bacterium]
MENKKATFNELIQGEKPVLVDFFATWCGPCQAMQPILKDLTEEIGDQAHIIKVDVDKNQAAAQHFGVRGVPTFILFKDGEIKWQQAGIQPKHQLKQLIEQYA